MSTAMPNRMQLKRRGSSLDLTNHQASASDSDGSSHWSPPDTPTPIRYLTLPKKSRLQPGRTQSQHGVSVVASPSRSNQFSFTVPTVKRPHSHHSSSSTSTSTNGSSSAVRRSAYLVYRGHGQGDNFSSDGGEMSSDDGEVTETELGTALRGAGAGGGVHQHSDAIDTEGDEVDMSLSNIPPSPLPSSPTIHYSKGWKGKKRMRDHWNVDEKMRGGNGSGSDEDGDDEAETEIMLDRKWVKHAKRVPQYLDEKMSQSTGSMGAICKRMDGLQASSTIFSMSIDSDYPVDIKPPTLTNYHSALKASSRPRPLRANRRLKKRGQQKRCFQKLTASEDPLVGLPIFREWPATKSLIVTSGDGDGELSSMEISDLDERQVASDIDIDSEAEADAEMGVLSDIEVRSTDEVSASTHLKVVQDFKDDDTVITSPPVEAYRTKIRACYEQDIPLTRVQLAAVDMQLSNPARGIHRRPRYKAFPERVAGQHSTSHLHRRSPSSLLPVRRVLIKKSQRYAIKDKVRVKPGRTEFNTCFNGQTFLALLRTRRAACQARRSKIQIFNERTKHGIWRSMVGNWWGHAQVVAMTNKWWLAPRLAPQTKDEVEVENILGNDSDDESMATASTASTSPSSSSRAALRTFNKARKRAARESEEDNTSEVEERWARRNLLRAQELETYHLKARIAVQRREIEARRRREAEETAAARARVAELEQARLEQQQRRLAEEVARQLQREEAARIAREAAEEFERDREERERLQSPPSPSPTDISIVSEPPEYEFPFYPVVMARPAHLPVLAPAPVISRRRGPVQVSPARSDILPDYLPDRYTNLSPPPPPPYNARTDCQTVIPPIFIEDDDEEDDIEREDEVDLASPLVPSRRGRPLRRYRSSSPEVIGAFPAPVIHSPTPVRHNHRASIDPIRAFEAALDLEEGEGEAQVDEEADQVERGVFDTESEADEVEEDDEEGDIVPGGRVAGVFQRVFGLVWGGATARR
ncbi:hypothetical protein CI109_103730 [Kwoniella shandongensis]|uniref:Uncharacterized protein n=1 Tax=Kwoniella shandongensis TaxID=1734106 RepID=A0A5M6C7P8_9TREE|nr:uncharacterized protein CI109_000575 [Kwoniella shandongensis]KAA5531003.1 hypothetical protein CI109_000575 [Kwoniella shandongensis]